MAHYVTTNTWANGDPVTPAQIQDFSRKVAHGISRRGGAFAGADPHVITGSGLVLICPVIIDGAGVSPGAGLLQSLGTGRFQHADGDWNQLGPTHTGRTLARATSGLEASVIPWYGGRVRGDLGGTQNQAPMLVQWDGSIVNVQQMLPMQAMTGAQPTSITLSFRVGAPHDAAPIVMPKVAFLAIDHDGTSTALTKNASGADAAGYVPISAAASGSSFYADGSIQTVTVSVDATAAALDPGSFTYWVSVVDETPGSSAPPWRLNVKQPVIAASSPTQGAIALTGASNVDGVTAATGSRILIKDNASGIDSGVWIAAAGAWARAPDAAASSDFVPYFLVPVSEGGTTNGNARSVWCCTSLAAVPGTSSISFSAPVAFPALNAKGGPTARPAGSGFSSDPAGFVPYGLVVVGAVLTTAVTQIEWQA